MFGLGIKTSFATALGLDFMFRTHCDNKSWQVGLNQNYDIFYFIP